ncbi:MAG: chemotaxis response regulator protein-glutamate methylesterase [Sporocytophaga sp.]|uniref:protein-glutamate methylesterase/protein-glutamine glutaminase n=1 Tax=Sporocytophaga sp. TaxID=2231183 RepID=UPI001B118E55|nr:chemotaxis response regulator protein-glutamate methylesterase [Sporocytophaga sp.]MBO9703137.1 chemotaxis response regulator protein-glutamate methylesterase [Sporocytophaga sp.]
MKKTRVLIVDDSAVIRQTLKEIIDSDPELEVLATAGDPYFAVSKIADEIPDVITLDIEMPRMDGLTFLKKIMSQHPIPVVIISSLTQEGTESAIKALELGAVEVLHKPQLNSRRFIEEYKTRICEVIKAAAKSKVSRKKIYPTEIPITNNIEKIKSSNSLLKTTEKVIAVGASTGGTEAIRSFLEYFPADAPGIVIVQHMPELFTKSFATRLNSLCKIDVKEAENGDSVIRGRALIAPGNKHMLLKRSGARYFVELKDGPLVNRHKPSVDVLFRSTATNAGKNSIGIIMTGMGSDGAKGLLEMKEAGALTLAQDEKSCVVFGMPKEAIKLNAVEKILPLDQLGNFVLKHQF